MLAYLHIPFCDSKCFYCAFNSTSSHHGLKKAYSFAITKQLEKDLEIFKTKQITSLFIGGGTPSTFKVKYFKEFFSLINPYLTKDCEITVEANPNSATSLWLEGMRELGVNRISFGVQSFFDEKLKLLGRTHDKNEAIKAVKRAYKADFKDISLDIMYGTKFDTKKSLEKEINQALLLPINHISAYSLTIEENTPFFHKKDVQNDDINLANFLAKTLDKNGFIQYEVSNYGKPCKHNLGYWQHKPYLGIGAGGVGFDGKSRFYPPLDITEYIKNPLTCKQEELNDKELQTEKLFLGLRSNIGIKSQILTKNQLQKANILLKEKKLTCKQGTFFCNDFFLADEIALFLMD